MRRVIGIDIHLTFGEVVIEATGNCMAVSRVLTPHVKRVVIANPLQVKAIVNARPRMRRHVARRYQVVRHRTRIKNEVHAILHAHLIPKCPHASTTSVAAIG